MSRSYKKFPLYRDNLWGKSLKEGKKRNNRMIRRKLKRDPFIDVSNGTDYRRLGMDSWDLWEYRSFQTIEDTINSWEEDQAEIANGINSWKSKHNTSLEEAITDWYKFYKRK